MDRALESNGTAIFDSLACNVADEGADHAAADQEATFWRHEVNLDVCSGQQTHFTLRQESCI